MRCIEGRINHQFLGGLTCVHCGEHLGGYRRQPTGLEVAKERGKRDRLRGKTGRWDTPYADPQAAAAWEAGWDEQNQLMQQDENSRHSRN